MKGRATNYKFLYPPISFLAAFGINSKNFVFAVTDEGIMCLFPPEKMSMQHNVASRSQVAMLCIHSQQSRLKSSLTSANIPGLSPQLEQHLHLRMQVQRTWTSERASEPEMRAQKEPQKLNLKLQT